MQQATDAAQQPQSSAEFKFNLSADKDGLVAMEFSRDAPLVLQTIVMACDRVNQSFDAPFPTLSAFFDALANSTRKIEGKRNAEDHRSKTQT